MNLIFFEKNLMCRILGTWQFDSYFTKFTNQESEI